MPGLRSSAAAALAFCVLTAAVTYPQAAVVSTSIANHPDPYFSIWRLGWVAHQLAANPRHLFDANIFYPERGTFAYSDAMLLPGAAAAPLFWLHVPPVVIYNAALLGALALSGFTMFLLARQVTGSAPAAVAAGMVYAFAPYRFEQYVHLEMQMVFWIPLALLMLHRVAAGRRLRDGIGLGLTLAAQMFSGVYGAMYLFVSLMVFAPALIIASGARQIGRLLAPLAAAVLVAAALIAPYALAYADAAATAGPRGIGEIRHYGASLASYAAAPSSNRLYGAWTSRLGGEELNLFPGLTALALAGVGLAGAVARRSRVPLAYAVLLVFAADASRGFDGYVFRIVYRYLPPMRALRVPSRFALFVNLALGVLAAYGLADLLRNRSRRARTALAGAAAVLMLVEYASSPALAVVPRPSLADRWLASQPPGVLAEFPLPRPGAMWPNDESLFMYHGMAHWLPTVNGYSGFFPASYLQLIRAMQTFPDERSLDYLRGRGVTYVLVRRRFYDDERWKTLQGRLDDAPGLRLLAGFPAPGSELVYTLNSDMP
jgi:hypothetical protein